MSVEIDTATHLIGLLRQTELFSEVDFTGQLACPPHLEVVALSGRGDGISIDPEFLWLLAGSLALTSENGTAFAIANDERERFDLPYRETLVIGVFPVLANPILATGLFDRWSVFGDGIADDLQRYLLADSNRLLMHAEGPDVLCPVAE